MAAKDREPLNVRPAVIARRVREAMQVNVVSELSSCPVPILYLRGDHDRVVPKHNLDEIMSACPSMKVVHFPAPHPVLQTLPALTAAAISTFAAGLDQMGS